jgi:hypothetical protein
MVRFFLYLAILVGAMYLLGRAIVYYLSSLST